MKKFNFIFVLIILVLCLSVFIGCKDSNPLEDAYYELKEYVDYGDILSCLTKGDDFSYVSIDTNPYDREDYYNVDYLEIIEKYNELLDLPDYLYEDMLHTSALDGAQTESFDNITVRWKYHPDNGLEVTYKYSK